MATTNTTDFYRRPYLTTFTFAVGLLLFLLPFFDIKCNNVTVAQFSGKDMATGGRPSVSRDLDNMQRRFPGAREEDEQSMTKTRGDGHLFYTTLAALALGVIGLILSFLNRSQNQKPNMIVGILGAVALIGSWIEIGAYVKDNVKAGTGETMDTNFSPLTNVSASPTFWFILCLFCFIAAAYFSYKQSQLLAVGQIPPQAAPQIKIENPGEQSEFPAAPHDDRDLG